MRVSSFSDHKAKQHHHKDTNFGLCTLARCAFPSGQSQHVLSGLSFHHPVETCWEVEDPYSLGMSHVSYLKIEAVRITPQKFHLFIELPTINQRVYSLSSSQTSDIIDCLLYSIAGI